MAAAASAHVARDRLQPGHGCGISNSAIVIRETGRSGRSRNRKWAFRRTDTMEPRLHFATELVVGPAKDC